MTKGVESRPGYAVFDDETGEGDAEDGSDVHEGAVDLGFG